MNCAKVISADEQKMLLSSKRKCFNCAGEGHQDHISISDKGRRKGKNLGVSMLCTKVSKALVYPVDFDIRNRIKCRVVLDIDLGSDYVPSSLIS